MHLGDKVTFEANGKAIEGTIINCYVDYGFNIYEVEDEDGNKYALQGEEAKEQSNGEDQKD